MADEAGGPREPTVRERRAERHRRESRRAAPARLTRRALVPAILVLVVAGIGAALYWQAQTSPDCPGHWHAAYAVFVDGEPVGFPRDAAHARMYDPVSGHDHHLHADDGIYHFHPPASRCISAEAMMERLEVEVDGDTLVLGPAHGELAGRHGPDGNRTLQVWHQPYGEAWRLADWRSLSGDQLGDGDRLLLTYGALDEATLEAQKASLKDLGTYDPGDT